MGPGQDPHSFKPAARDLTAAANAHIIFVNGWHLEEGLEEDLENIGEEVPVVAISANIEPLAFAEGDHGGHGHGEEHGEHAFEWAGVFDLAPGEYTWTSARVDGEYADPAMKMVVLETDDSDAHGIEHVEGKAEELLESSDTETKENGSTLVPAETAYQVTFDEALEVSSFTVSVEEQGYYVFFTEHMPFEFEADEHFFKDSLGEDVEPSAEEPESGHHDHHHGAHDPHVWFSIHSVEQWVENAEHVLSDLDPGNAEVYEANAAAYLAELETLEAYAAEQLSQMPEDNRFLVTNHDAFGYFAHEYDISVLGTIIPSMSTLAEPSASDLAELITEMEEHGVCTIFTETTVSDALAQTVAAELSGCDKVQVQKLYTGAVGPAGSGADSYIGMFRHNVDAIVDGLK
jgi:zinc/manganese transport system substrate-binding protein